MRRPPRTDAVYIAAVKDFYRSIEDYDWNRVVDQKIGLESFLHRAREQRTRQLITTYARGRCLDAGCGTGLMLRHLPAGAVGLDLNPRHVARAQRYAPAARVQVGDIEALPFPDASFDTVVCTEVLEHVVHPSRALTEIRRVLTSGGCLIGSTPRHALLWRFRWLSATHQHNEPFHNEFTAAEVRALLRDWQVVTLRPHIFRSTFFFVAAKRS